MKSDVYIHLKKTDLWKLKIIDSSFEEKITRKELIRGGIDLMPEQETRPVNKYLPPKPRQTREPQAASLLDLAEAETPKGFWKWMDSTLERLG